MFDACAGKPSSRLLIEFQSVVLGSVGQGLPFCFQSQNQAEVPRIHPFCGTIPSVARCAIN